MSSSPYRPDPRYPELGDDFADAVKPANFPETVLRYRNNRWARHVGLDHLSDGDWLTHFGRFALLDANLAKPLALRYHGHQFGTYNPDIGDGRGFLFAQLRDDQDRLLDLGTKGSGQTPYSRFGDGRLTLKGGVRESLATAYLEAHGVYTSKTFSLIETGEALQRNDEPSPTRSAVMVRLQHSHVRFGTFQRQAYENKPENIAALVDHCVHHYHPQAKRGDRGDQAVAFLTAVVEANAAMVASWMAAGFVHGVMNTDNFNVTGETFDFGPYRFIPKSDPNFVAAYFDQQGLYRFGRQPTAALWNLQQLATTLTLVAEAEPLADALKGFETLYPEALRNRAFALLGLQTGALEEDLSALTGLYTWLTETGLSWPQVHFDLFCGAASGDRTRRSPLATHYTDAKFTKVREDLLSRAPLKPERLDHPYFSQEMPQSLLIDEIEAIWDAIAAEDNWAPFYDKLDALEQARQALDLTPSPRI